jgi:hypothetical protein
MSDSIVLEIKDTINKESSASYLELHLEIESECRFKNETRRREGEHT